MLLRVEAAPAPKGSPPANEPSAPQLGCSAILALASLLPHGLLPAAAAPPLPPRAPASLAVLGEFSTLLPAVCGWHAAALRPGGGTAKAWLGAAIDHASGKQLAPLATAVLTLYAHTGHGRVASGGATFAGMRLTPSPGGGTALDAGLVEAAALTPSEAALAQKLELACRHAPPSRGAHTTPHPTRTPAPAPGPGPNTAANAPSSPRADTPRSTSQRCGRRRRALRRERRLGSLHSPLVLCRASAGGVPPDPGWLGGQSIRNLRRRVGAAVGADKELCAVGC